MSLLAVVVAGAVPSPGAAVVLTGIPTAEARFCPLACVCATEPVRVLMLLLRAVRPVTALPIVGAGEVAAGVARVVAGPGVRCWTVLCCGATGRFAGATPVAGAPGCLVAAGF
jgi:hypothetical protein